MDQVKQYLAVLKKHHFWVLCGLVTLMGLVFWWTATSSLRAEYQANKTTIETKSKDVDAVLAINPHPNEKGVERLSEEIEEEKAAVLKAWQTLYDRQKAEVFQWPESLGDYFINYVEAPENKNFIKRDYRQIYAEAIDEEVMKLGEIVDADWPKTSAALSGTSMTGSMSSMSSMMARPPGSGYPGATSGSGYGMLEDQKQYKVIWDPSNQQEIMDWYRWTEVPPTVAIHVAQEDLWVYQALCRIIAEANSDSIGAHDAAVQQINKLNVGYDAAVVLAGSSTAQRIEMPGGDAAGGSENPEMGSTSLMPSMMSGSEEGGAGAIPPRPVGGGGGFGRGGSTSSPMMSPMLGMGGDGATEELPPEEKYMNWRYVSQDGTPLTSEELSSSEMVGYRLLPFRMSLMVDQRKYARLLVECRNSILPVVVREVRINPSTMSEGSGMGGMGRSMLGSMSRGPSSSMMPGRSPMSSGRSPMSAIGPSSASGSGMMGTARTETHVYPVEITGYVYLIAPPDLEKLSAAAEGEALPEDQSLESVAEQEAKEEAELGPAPALNNDEEEVEGESDAEGAPPVEGDADSPAPAGPAEAGAASDAAVPADVDPAAPQPADMTDEAAPDAATPAEGAEETAPETTTDETTPQP